MSEGAGIPAGLMRESEVTGDLRLECGVVIVGSGAGGSTMAAELADAGVDVIMVEEGGYHPTESFTAEAGRALRTLYRDGGVGLALGKPPVLFSRGTLRRRFHGGQRRDVVAHPAGGAGPVGQGRGRRGDRRARYGVVLCEGRIQDLGRVPGP